MRNIAAYLSALLITLLSVHPANTGEIQLAKVYRDYPGYFNPAVCENPNLDKAAKPPVTPAPPAPVVPPAPLPVVVPSPSTVARPVVAEQPPVMPVPPPAPAAVEAVVTQTPPAVVAPKPVVVEQSPVEPVPPPVPAPVETPTTVSVPAAPSVHVATPTPVEPGTDVSVTSPAGQEPAGHLCSPSLLRHDNSVNAPYLTLWGGVAATRDTDFDTTPGIDIEFDSGYAVGLGLGYDFGPARLEVEISQRETDSDKVEVGGVEVDADADLKIRTLMLNGYADFATGGSVTPYLGAGIGVAKVELDGEDDDVLAGQLAAGVLVSVSENVAVDIGYRFMMTDDPEIHGENYDVRQHTATIGVQIRF